MNAYEDGTLVGLVVVMIFLTLAMVTLVWLAVKAVRWAKKAPKGAYILIAFMPFVSIFPIPPQAYEQLDKSRVKQEKRKQQSGKGKEINTQI